MRIFFKFQYRLLILSLSKDVPESSQAVERAGADSLQT